MLRNRQLLIGLDAMEWKLVTKWASEGKLPTFRRLRFLLACPLSNTVSGYDHRVNRQPDPRCSMRNGPRANVREVG